MPIRKAVDRVLVQDRKSGRRKLVRVSTRAVDMWGQYDFPMSPGQAESILRRLGVIENGMIVIDY